MIRVGRCVFDKNGRRTDPSFENFTSILVLMKGHNEWGTLGPYELKDENGIIFENYYQACKVYPDVPKSTQRYSRWDNRVIWQHESEKHHDKSGILPAYWLWREKLMKNKFAVRYPVGFHHRHKCLFSIKDQNTNKKLNYIEARKQIYLPEYCRLVREQKKFHELKKRLENGENLLIIEVDGPHQESMDYYRENYGVDKKFIQRDTVIANDENLHILLNDDTHPFGHGYCLAIALLDLDYLITLGD